MRFRYPRRRLRIYLGVLLAAIFLGIILWPILSQAPGWLEAEIDFAIPIFIFFSAASANFYLVNSDIEISDDRICWILPGWRWKEIEWKDVARIRILSTWDFENNGWMRMLSVDQENRSRLYFRKRGSIFFTEKIAHFDDLMRVIEERARQRTIPIADEQIASAKVQR